MAKGKSTKSRAKAEPGDGEGHRARAEIDLEQLAELASIQCTQEEAAAVLKIDKRTLQRRLADDPIAAETWERGRESGKQSLRRVQWKLALRGQPTMLVWLGKQYLGQRDRMEYSLDPATLERLTDEQVARIAAGEDPARVVATLVTPQVAQPPVN